MVSLQFQSHHLLITNHFHGTQSHFIRLGNIKLFHNPRHSISQECAHLKAFASGETYLKIWVNNPIRGFPRHYCRGLKQRCIDYACFVNKVKHRESLLACLVGKINTLKDGLSNNYWWM
ncbi:hypothetical protein CEXT_427121 [Caerostris extrusa]|uniref:Uncharacterized protein n=1 Tax=Caerostris extrusa TaxID=172846 RepID=A0AAV4RQL6_CAEEX|nr:hypothetical protein CEXT_427121 [Caerostris extrusa]